MKAQALSKKVMQRKIIKETVEEKEINVIIIADYHNLDLESPLIDLQYVIGLGLPIATIDSLCFGPKERLLHNQLFAGSSSKARNKYEVKLRQVPEEMKVIRTCPINNPYFTNERIFPVTLYTESFQVESWKKKRVKQQFGCTNENDKLVMVSKSAWANLMVKMRLMETSTHMKSTYNYEYFIQELITEYFGKQQADSKVYVIGVVPNDGFISEAQEQSLQFISLPFLDLEAYEEVLFSCDLFITDNITSASMAKALFAYVPTLCLVNSEVSMLSDGQVKLPAEWKSARLQEIMSKWLTVMPKGIYPFLTYPNGWVDELSPLLTDNPWMEAIDKSEIFDLVGTGEKIKDMLYCEEVKQSILDKQKAYIEKISQINKADEMIEFILN